MVVEPNKRNAVVPEVAHENISDISSGEHEPGVLEPEVREQDVLADEESRHPARPGRDQFVVRRSHQMHQVHEAIHLLAPRLGHDKSGLRMAIVLDHLAHGFPNIRRHTVGAFALEVPFRSFRKKDLAFTTNYRHGGIMKGVPEPDVELLHNPNRMRKGLTLRSEFLSQRWCLGGG